MPDSQKEEQSTEPGKPGEAGQEQSPALNPEPVVEPPQTGPDRTGDKPAQKIILAEQTLGTAGTFDGLSTGDIPPDEPEAIRAMFEDAERIEQELIQPIIKRGGDPIELANAYKAASEQSADKFVAANADAAQYAEDIPMIQAALTRKKEREELKKAAASPVVTEHTPSPSQTLTEATMTATRKAIQRAVQNSPRPLSNEEVAAITKRVQQEQAIEFARNNPDQAQVLALTDPVMQDALAYMRQPTEAIDMNPARLDLDDAPSVDIHLPQEKTPSTHTLEPSSGDEATATPDEQQVDSRTVVNEGKVDEEEIEERPRKDLDYNAYYDESVRYTLLKKAEVEDDTITKEEMQNAIRVKNQELAIDFVQNYPNKAFAYAGILPDGNLDVLGQALVDVHQTRGQELVQKLKDNPTDETVGADMAQWMQELRTGLPLIKNDVVRGAIANMLKPIMLAERAITQADTSTEPIETPPGQSAETTLSANSSTENGSTLPPGPPENELAVPVEMPAAPLRNGAENNATPPAAPVNGEQTAEPEVPAAPPESLEELQKKAEHAAEHGDIKILLEILTRTYDNKANKLLVWVLLAYITLELALIQKAGGGGGKH